MSMQLWGILATIFIGDAIILRTYRKRKGISQAELEKLTNLDRKTIFRIENDINMPLVDTFAKIALALDMTDEEIATEVKNTVTPINTNKSKEKIRI